MLPSEHLQKARDLIARPGGWTQGAFARDANGLPDHDDAVCFCAVGAIRQACADADALRPVTFLCRAAGTWSIPDWNDEPGRIQAEVVAAFNDAIAIAKAEGC